MEKTLPRLERDVEPVERRHRSGPLIDLARQMQPGDSAVCVDFEQALSFKMSLKRIGARSRMRQEVRDGLKTGEYRVWHMGAL